MRYAVNSHTRTHRQAGWSLVEMLVILAIIGTVGAMAALVMPGVIALTKADSAASQLEATLRTAREQAISQRRCVRVTFTDPNIVQVRRLRPDCQALDTTVEPLLETVLEGGAHFLLFSGIVADTGDGFGRNTAAWFGSSDVTSVQFTSEGTFVNQHGDETSGTVSIGVPQQPLTARAVTIFGPTALIREWRWDGAHWVN